ncbi:hypothetical protein MNBD_GAMMA13-1344 [hydrothermal vent metagenome]|uniref:Uncharacterized protein n=1 Tax=hydrothermal vent metagenome TaxID=652676 RepID=A0A3B0YUN3_9ZZZZ
MLLSLSISTTRHRIVHHRLDLFYLQQRHSNGESPGMDEQAMMTERMRIEYRNRGEL